MLRAIFALFLRSLREEMRFLLPHLIRTGLLTAILLGMTCTRQGFGYRGAPGLELMIMLIWWNFAFLIFMGISFFSSAITEEKEEETLPLLRMTNLSPVAILLGKSTSRLFSALLLISSQLPFTVLAVSLGGVSMNQAIGVYATLLAFAVLLANVCLFASVIMRHTRKAVIVSILLMIFLGSFPFLLESLLPLDSYRYSGAIPDWVAGATEFIDFLKNCEPPVRISLLLSTGFSGPAIDAQVWSNLILGGVFFLLSWLVFERFNREETTLESSPVKRGWSRLLRPLNFLRRHPLQTQQSLPAETVRAGSESVFWKDFHVMYGGFRAWLRPVLITGVAILLIQGVHYLDDGTWAHWRDIREIILLFGFWISALLSLSVAAGAFQREVRDKTLSALMLLPLSFWQILRQKFLAGFLFLLPHLLILLAFLLDEEDFYRGLFGSNFMPFMSMVMIFVGATILQLSLVTLFSLYMRWAAIPVAVCAFLLAAMLSGLLFGRVLFRGVQEEYFLVALFCFAGELFLSWCFFSLVSQRLSTLAARE